MVSGNLNLTDNYFKTMDKSIMTSEEASIYHNISNIQLEDGLNLIDNLSPQSSDSVLDMGCGTGRLCMVLSERLSDGGKVLGIDPDAERISVANKGRKDSMTNLQFAVGSDQTFPEDQYDAVISTQVIHWIKNKDATFKRVYDNLKPGGKFAIATITKNGIPDLLVELVKLCGSDAFDAVMSCSYYESLDFYKQKAKEYGFSVVGPSQSTENVFYQTLIPLSIFTSVPIMGGLIVPILT